MNARQSLLTAALIGLIGLPTIAAPPAKLALQGGRIITVTGKDIAHGTLLIENGKITAIGADVKVPYDAMVVDTTGKVLFPGVISPHTSEGLDRPNENLPVTPFLDVCDAIDPSSLSFENALRDGVLAMHIIQGNGCAIGGLSRLVHPIGRTPDEMTILPRIALKINMSPYTLLDRMSLMATLRESFQDLDDYLGNVAEQRYEAKLKEEKKKVSVTPDKARELGRALIRDRDCDDKHANLFRLTTGRLDAWIYCGAATDVAPAIELAKKNGFLDRAVFVLGNDAYRAVQELKQVKRPVVLDADLMHQERDPISGELRETFIPKMINDAGVTFALQPNTRAPLAERYLTYQAARCVRQGISRQTALQAITINPARMLGVGDQLGTLEVGKDAYVLVLSGDPLDFDSWVEKAYVRGVLAYDRDKDVRLNKLLGLQRQFDAVAAKKAAQEKATRQKNTPKKPAGPPADGKKAGTKKPAPGGKEPAKTKKKADRPAR